MEQGWGEVVLSPAGGVYVQSTEVTATAIGASEYVFDHWEGVATDSGNVVTVKMDGPRQLTAVFKASDVRFFLSESVSPAQSGTVFLSPPQPAEGYAINTRVTAVADAASGYCFSRWQESLAGSSPEASIFMDRNRSVVALFNPGVVIDFDPQGQGTVLLEPPQGASGYSPGTEVTLTATAAEGYRFDHWSGDVSGSKHIATMTVDAPKVVTAHLVEEGRFAWWWLAIGGAVLLAVAFVIVRLLRAARVSSEY